MNPGQFAVPRTQGGMVVNQPAQQGLQPVASPAMAKAYETWVAQGGGIRESGRLPGKFRHEYRRGPMKGMTQQEAQMQFERMWQSSSDAVKEEFAQRAGMRNLSPSERAAAGYAPQTPKTAKQMYADQKKSRMEYYARINGGEVAPIKQQAAAPAAEGGAAIDQEPDARRAALAAEAAGRAAARDEVQMQADDPQLNQRTSNPNSSSGAGYGEKFQGRDANGASMEPAQTPTSDGQAIGTPEEQARVREMMQEGEDFATADLSGGWGAAYAQSQQSARDEAAKSRAEEDVYKYGTPEQKRALDVKKAQEMKEGRARDLEWQKGREAAKAQKATSAANSLGLDTSAVTVPPTSAPPAATPAPQQQPVMNPGGAQAPVMDSQSQPTRADNIGAAGGDLSKLSTDDRVAAKRVAAGVTPEQSQRLLPGVNPTAAVDLVNGGAGQQAKLPNDIKNAAPGSVLVGDKDPIPQGMEFTGMRGGKKLYEPMAAVYGQAAVAGGKTQDQIQTEYQTNMRGAFGLDKPAPLPAPRGPASQADYSVANDTAAYRQARDSRIADANVAAQKAISQGRAADAIKTPFSDAAFKQYGSLEKMPTNVQYGVNQDGTQMTQKQFPPQVAGITSPIERRRPTGFAMARRF